MGSKIVLSSEDNRWETPQEIFDFLNKRFGPFVLDAAASAENTLCDYYFDEELDGLQQDWFGKVFNNPPYGKGRITEKWVSKYIDELENNPKVESITVLLSAKPETIWFQELVWPRLIGIGIIRRMPKTGLWFVSSFSMLDFSFCDFDTENTVSKSNSVLKRKTEGVIGELYFIKSRLKFGRYAAKKGEKRYPSTFPSCVLHLRRSK